LLIAYFSMRYVSLPRGVRSGRFYQIVLGGLAWVNAEKTQGAVTFGIRPVGYCKPTLDFGIRTLDFGFRLSAFGFRLSTFDFRKLDDWSYASVVGLKT